MRIDPSVLSLISELAMLQIKKHEEYDLLESLNSVVEDFSILNDFQLEEEIDISSNISLREDIPNQYPTLESLYNNFPHFKDRLLIAPKLNSQE